MRSDVRPAIGLASSRPAGRTLRNRDTCNTEIGPWSILRYIGQTCHVREAEHLVDRRPAKIGVDEQHPARVQTRSA